MTNYPGPQSKILLDEFENYGVVPTRPFVIDMASCNGIEIVTIDGQIILDWAGYYGSKLLGHNHPAYSDLEFQDKLLSAAMNKISNPDFVTPELVEYYRFLHQNAPKCIANPNLRVYTVNSGAEATENALKYCVHKWFQKNYNSSLGTPKFISFTGGFHGRTVYSLHVTDMPHNRNATRYFNQLIASQNILLPFPDTTDYSVQNSLYYVREQLKANYKSIAGIIIEPMQGAGGHNVTTAKFFQELSTLSHMYDVPLIFDEVQTGGGQCGSMWMSDMFDLPYAPTCVISAKKLGCGVVYMHDLISEAGVLDSTWSGHIVDMVRVVHEYSIIKKEYLIETVIGRGKYLTDGLTKLAKRHPLITKIRGSGLYQGFSVPTSEIKIKIINDALQNESLLLLGAGTDTIRFRPNICVNNNDIDNLLQKLNNVFSRL